MFWIESQDIADWGKRFNAKGQLPRYLARLIRATTPVDTIIEFPSGKDVYSGGWDGVVSSTKKTAYVPDGLSLWEIGTERNTKTKADGDYTKRTTDPLGYDASNTTLVIVTSNKWQKKEKWRREKIAEGVWKDIKVYDANNLAEWLNQTGAVAREFVAEIGKYPFDGIQTADHFWEEYSIGPRGQLHPTVVTVGRQNEVSQLKQFLNDKDPRIIAVKASSKEEAIAFIIATAKQFEVHQQENFFSRGLIIDTPGNFRGICNNQHGMFLIPRFEQVQILYNGVANGHHVLLPMGADDTFNSNDIIILPRLDRDGLKHAMKLYGLSDDEADKMVIESGRNITILKRLLQFPQNKVEWAEPKVAREIIPALLLGRWDETKEGDRQIISALSGLPFDDYLSKIARWKDSDIPLFYQIGSTWRLASPLDAWANIAQYITSKDLGLLEESVTIVLKNIRPSFDLPPEKRMMAAFYGKESIYSGWLREGLTQTLVLVGIYGSQLHLSTQTTSQSWVDSIIRKIFSEAEGKLWASLNYLMPLMAEVSPDAFLESINQSLNRKHPEILAMFDEEPSLFMTESHHTGLLWALEGLAWFPEFLTRVTSILGKLSSLDPGGKIINRPINSLRTIFLPWMPQTSASQEERHMAIEVLIRDHPTIAWNLMISLLPKDHDVAHPSHKTRWRAFTISEPHRLTYADIAVDNAFYITRLLSLAGVDEQRLAQLLSASESSRIELDNRSKITSHIVNLLDQIVQNDYSIWNEARSILHRHRSHPDTDWALPEQALSNYQLIFEKLYPGSPIEKHRWLFEEHWPHFSEGFQFEEKSHEEQQAYIDQRRQTALREIYERGGIDELNNLSNIVKEKWAVGQNAASIINDVRDELAFITEEKLLDSQEMYSVMAFIAKKEQLNGWEWVKSFFLNLKDQQFSNKALSVFFLSLMQGKQLWDFLASQERAIENHYWKLIRPFLYNLTSDERKYTIDKLVDAGRTLTALHELPRFVKDLETAYIDSLLRLAVSSKEQIVFPDYEVKQIFDELYQRKDITRIQLAELEWMYLRIFTKGYRKSTKLVIYQELSANPQFFIDLIKWLYKPGNESASEESAEMSSEKRATHAQQAYHLFSSWGLVPGMSANGDFDAHHLKEWVNEVRKLAKEQDRELGADIEIGKILAQYPETNNMTTQWPPDTICEIIDSINSDAINRNFATAVFNKRGSSSKAPFEGGQRERNIALYFHSLHDKIVNKWPITASILKKLAKGYEEDAVREDQRAERDSLDE